MKVKTAATIFVLIPVLGVLLVSASFVYKAPTIGAIGVAIIGITIAGAAVALVAAPIIGIWKTGGKDEVKTDGVEMMARLNKRLG
jgi:hypothetical protein